jgi:hypothetical protein
MPKHRSKAGVFIISYLHIWIRRINQIAF